MMAAGLNLHAVAAVNQQNSHIGGRSAGGHVPRILFVAGRIGDDELALVGGEEAVGHINGDALFALGGQTVHEQRQVNLVALRAGLHCPFQWRRAGLRKSVLNHRADDQ